MKDYSLKINGHSYKVQIDDTNETPTVTHVIVNGVDYEVEIEGTKSSTVSKPQVAPAPASANSNSVTPAAAASSHASSAAPTSGYSVKSPLPGTVLDVKVTVGATVAKGQTLLVLEAMKMENSIDADRNGVVKQICVQQGATVMEGDTLLVIE